MVYESFNNREPKVYTHCRVCGKEKSQSAMLSHARAAHPLAFDDYFKSKVFINYIPAKSKVKPFGKLNTSEAMQIIKGAA